MYVCRLGIGVIGMMGVQWAAGLLIYANPWCPSRLKQNMMGVHRTIGAISILLSLVVLFTGYARTYMHPAAFSFALNFQTSRCLIFDEKQYKMNDDRAVGFCP